MKGRVGLANRRVSRDNHIASVPFFTFMSACLPLFYIFTLSDMRALLGGGGAGAGDGGGGRGDERGVE